MFPLIVALAVGCGAPHPEPPAPAAAAATPAPLAIDMRRQLPVGNAERRVSITGLRSWILREGTGPVPALGQAVDVNYAGFMTDGSFVDSSLRRGQPATFTLGAGQVIPGWEEAIAAMHVGELRKIEIPPHLGYGEDGGGVMPPGTTLVFDIELVAVR